jgi:hypothetical protein
MFKTCIGSHITVYGEIRAKSGDCRGQETYYDMMTILNKAISPYGQSSTVRVGEHEHEPLTTAGVAVSYDSPRSRARIIWCDVLFLKG